jgi:hypothetical protein
VGVASPPFPFDRTNGVSLDGWDGREPHAGWSGLVQSIETFEVEAGRARRGEIAAALARSENDFRARRQALSEGRQAAQDARILGADAEADVRGPVPDDVAPPGAPARANIESAASSTGVTSADRDVALLTRPLSESQLDVRSRRRAFSPPSAPVEPGRWPSEYGDEQRPERIARDPASPRLSSPPAWADQAAVSAPAPASRPSRGTSVGLWALVGAGGVAALLVAERLFGREIAALLTAAAKLLRLSTMALPAGPQDSLETVDVSVFAPRSAAPGDQLLVQVFLHAFDYEPEKVDAAAAAADPSAARKGEATLDLKLAHGDELHICIDAPGLQIDQPAQPLVWRGRARSVQFLVSVPEDHGAAPVQVRIRVLHASTPVGQVRFALQVDPQTAPQGLERVGHSAKRFSRAFLSYAHQDRVEVLKRAQALRAARIEVFQDLLSLEPGEEWNERLWSEIDQCDLFLLFWSQAARRSEWVTREVDRALANRERSGGATPEIMPVILEGPPPPEPPERFRQLHFDDMICYLIAAQERRAPTQDAGP